MFYGLRDAIRSLSPVRPGRFTPPAPHAVVASFIEEASETEGARILRDLLVTSNVRNVNRCCDALLDEFGSLAAILAAGPAAQMRVIGDEPEAIRCLTTVRTAMLHALATDVRPETVLSDTSALRRYLHAAMAYDSHEQLRVLFLNAGNRLLRDEVISQGGTTAAPVQVRQIMRRAVELGATALILAHNHPSGDPEPSSSDIRSTRELIEAARALEIVVHDHIIIARGGYSSLRALNLI